MFYHSHHPHPLHSTETGLVKIRNDLLMAAGTLSPGSPIRLWLYSVHSIKELPIPTLPCQLRCAPELCVRACPFCHLPSLSSKYSKNMEFISSATQMTASSTPPPSQPPHFPPYYLLDYFEETKTRFSYNFH